MDAGVDTAPPPRSCVGAADCFLPAELVPASPSCSGVHLALAGDWLFWSNTADQSVSKVHTSTHQIVGLVGLQNDPTFVAAIDGHANPSTVYWVLHGTEIRETYQPSASTLTGTTYEAIGGLFSGPAEAPALFYSAGLGIYRAGGGAAIGFEQTGVPAALAFNGSSVAFVTKDGNVDVIPSQNGGQLIKCATDAASNINCTRVATNQTRLLLDDVYLVDGQVYWASGASIYRASITAASTGLTPLATTAHGGDVASFFVAGSTIYLAEDGSIELAHVGGAVTATPIAAGQAHPSAVRADASNVYWTRSDCAIEIIRHE
jgi:hypothetical protein